MYIHTHINAGIDGKCNVTGAVSSYAKVCVHACMYIHACAILSV